ncbi:hypothetical protein GE09DRAFT_1074864 [Coniochaeta sp. 2T2.1]|nr:hypothetical protein GE09DRAFT_1074864 [Coniochaeta sp. 2T2.1]
MPLHLLGKKSWNVYNSSNVERVRRDEAAAQALEDAKEERMQEADAARRLAILRGEEPPPLPEEDDAPLDPGAGPLVKRDRDRIPGEKKKRKRTGEDDTDFEMRVARERAAEAVAGAGRRRSEVPLELAGLLAPEEERALVKPPGREEEAAAKARAAERLANPVLKDALGIQEDPWFLRGVVAELPGRDAWGKEDPGRKARDAVRIDKNDPLAMMKLGARKVREVTKERKREEEERERELKALRKEGRRDKRRKREGRGRNEDDELEGFSLDATVKGDESDRRETRCRSRERRSERSRDRRPRSERPPEDHPRDERRRHSREEGHRRPSRSEGDRYRSKHRRRSREGQDRERER